jgi:NADH-quinone oxidoreductase subunit F
MLGSGAVIVIGTGSCTVRNTWILSRFYAHESCGQCTPCREGVPWMEKILYRIEHGQGEEDDLDVLLDIAKGTMGTSICPLLEAAAMPVISAVENFRSEFEYHIKNKKCTHEVKNG